MSNRAKRCKYSHSQLQLADLNNDCLCEIFGHLNIDDLDHVSQISESFKSVADMIVPKKFESWMIEEYQNMRNKAYGPQRILVINRPLLEIVKLPSLFFYQYTKDLRLVKLLLIKDDEAVRLFKEMIHLEAVVISGCESLTGVCLKPLKDLKSVKLYGWHNYGMKSQTRTPTKQEFTSFLQRNQSIKELMFSDCPFILNNASVIAELLNLHTLHCDNDIKNSLNVKCLEVARMKSLRKVKYNLRFERNVDVAFLDQINATNVVEELEICGIFAAFETFLPQRSNIKILRLKSYAALWDFTKSLQMDNLEKLTLVIDQVQKFPIPHLILTLIKNLPKLRKLGLKVNIHFWEEPHDEIEKVLRSQNRKLEIRVANQLRYLIKWPLFKGQTSLQFTFTKNWDNFADDDD